MKSAEKSIEYIKASLAFENLYITQEDAANCKAVLTGEKVADEIIKDILAVQ